MQKSDYSAAFWVEQELCVYSADGWVYGAEVYVYSAALMGKERGAGLQCRGLGLPIWVGKEVGVYSAEVGLQRSFLGRTSGVGLHYRGMFTVQLPG